MLLQYKKYIYQSKKYKNSKIKLMYNPNWNLKIE